MPTVTLQLPDV